LSPHFSFTKDRRLLNKHDFSYVFDDAKRFSTRYLTLLYRPSPAGQARIGFVIAKKSIKRAVVRNIVKRQARETFRLFQHQLPPVDIVLLSKRGVQAFIPQDLRGELVYLWQKLAKSVVV
jgi:ribonuclease P protein component